LTVTTWKGELVQHGNFDLKDFLKRGQQKVDPILAELLPEATVPPDRLHEAMRYSVFAGGKRIRPLLVMASAEISSPALPLSNERSVLEAAAAVEILHTYSLVHDDLPAMDDDDLRRGKPTCHKAFDEATAILVGDGLQALAFEILASLTGADAERRAACVQILGQAVGSQGMVGGQMEDLLCEGCENPPADRLAFIHRHKTGLLIEACCVIGAQLGGGDEPALDHLRRYGACLGLAFQIADDVLDIVGKQENLGKTIGKDRSSSKATYPAVFGLEGAREKLRQVTQEAKESLDLFGDRATPLRALADFVATRDR